MTRRADDNADTVASRLDSYHEQTAPLIAYYDGRRVLRRVDAMGEIAAITQTLTTLTRDVIS